MSTGIGSRMVSRVALAKLGAAAFFSGAYFASHGPLVNFDVSIYGPRAVFTWFYELPNGINGGKPVITESLKKLIDETKPDLKLTPGATEKLEFRSVPMANPMFVGSGEFYKAYAVLPDHLNVSSISDLRSNSLNDYMNELYEYKITESDLWLSGAGKLLVDSFVLSEKAKKFLIARQAYLADNRNCLNFIPFVFILTYVFYLSMEAIQKQSRGRPLGPFARFIVPMSCGILVFSNFFILRYFTIQQQFADADAKAVTRGKMDSREIEEARKSGHAAPIDPDYYAGAVEYYNKEIQRHLSLRHLTKTTNPWFTSMFGSSFTAEGDYATSVLSYDPRASRSIRRIIAWKMGQKAPSD